MAYLAPIKLQQAFASENMTLDVHSDHVVIQGSAQCTEEGIRQIALQSDFRSPLISKYRLDGNFVYSRVPYKDADAYFRKEELEAILAHKKYSGSKMKQASSAWEGVARNRSFVLPAVGSCVSKVVEELSVDDLPVVEIGSGVGYEFSKKIASKTIRTQPSDDECFLLAQTTSDPIYKMTCQELCSCLQEQGKKIHCMLALNVFDTRSAEERRESFLKAAQVQSRGDRLVLMLDDNPEFTATLAQLEALNPGTVAFPYIPLSRACSKLSFILVPSQYVEKKPTPNDIARMIQDEVRALDSGSPSDLQIQLHDQKKEKNLKVVVLEDFFVEQVTKELADAGYATKVYYKASFVPAKSQFLGDIVFKSVTDTVTVRPWNVDDQPFKVWFESKHHCAPQIDEKCLPGMRARGEQFFGAEALVIEATKK
jgi:hypothetical protein